MWAVQRRSVEIVWPRYLCEMATLITYFSMIKLFSRHAFLAVLPIGSITVLLRLNRPLQELAQRAALVALACSVARAVWSSSE